MKEDAYDLDSDSVTDSELLARDSEEYQEMIESEIRELGMPEDKPSRAMLEVSSPIPIDETAKKLSPQTPISVADWMNTKWRRQ